MRHIRCIMTVCLITGMLYAQPPHKVVDEIQGYVFKLIKLEPFDYNQRFQGRKVLGVQGEQPCLRGTIIFQTPIEYTPVGIKEVCGVTEAQTNRETSLIIDDDFIEDFVDSFTNIGKSVLYLYPPGKKETMLTRLRGEAYFKIPIKENHKTMNTIASLQWMRIYHGKAAVIIMETPQDHLMYVILRYAQKYVKESDMLKLYLIDVETEEKNIFWKYTAFTDSLGGKILIYKTNF
ncbi:MAG: hypothetical protein GF384_01790, partial [Elusimicrobia bacterium]|nr:hypothetical protein [Elusimicrobiota bacterium]MBD3411725.1 hypothetical protein [Elusimicrobiota bacterium]